MRAFVFAGGEIVPSLITERPSGDDLVVAADSGYRNAAALGILPSLLVGDLDSLGSIELPREVEVLRVPAEKNETDTQLAVRTALSRGATELLLIGGLSGRLDHTLSTIGILEELADRSVRAVLTDGQSRVRFLRNDGLLLVRDARYRYLSLISLTERSRGVTVEGCKYPLDRAVLCRRDQYAVSNEIVGNAALVEVRRGALLVIESGDRY